ncbi:MAG: TetR/AcrR family transcriptional regulator [Myxococcota bacterium]
MSASLRDPYSPPGPGHEANPRSVRIFDAASRCFSEKGFQATTIIDIADAAGVSRPLVYKYFGDKDGLIDSVLRTIFAEWESLNAIPHLTSGEHPERTAAEDLRAKFEDAIEFVRERPIFRTILQQDPQIVIRGHLEDLRQCRRVSTESTRMILLAGIESGEFRQDLDEQATTASVEMILFGLLERTLGLRPELSLDPSLVRATLELLLEGLRSKESAS